MTKAKATKQTLIVSIVSKDDAKEQLAQLLQEEKRCGYLKSYTILEERTDLIKIRSIFQLMELTENEGKECFISNGIIRSSKHIRYIFGENKFMIENYIDSSSQKLKPMELYNKSNIGEAIINGGFYLEA